MGTEGHNTRVIAGRYRLEARLGRGGMGVVWRATDQLLGRGVAVKELPFDETLSAADARRQRDRTLREARAVAQLSHPHIIVVHDVVEDDERPYIVMELIEGGSLADRVACHGPVDAAEAARIAVDLLGALRAAHAAGVLHRDLKPDNVLLEAGTDRVVLTDFGIAQVAGAPTLTENDSFVGSPEYTAPERMSGARTGPESDLWSLGALMCAALSGESPFHRDSLGGILHAVVVGDIRPPAQAAPLLPVVQGLLERDPDRRLDADRAERMLRAFLDTGRTPQVPPPGYPPPEPDAHGGRHQDGTDREAPAPPAGAPGPDHQDEPFLHQPTRRVLVAALLVAAMAGAGVSAAALLMDEGAGDGGRTPTSSVPRTPTAERSAQGTHSPSAPAPTTATASASP
ncbi:serine/threonine protein kinase [Streptomyces djakartensis]|uniref:non-specific serine/threonine protein kinase n=1 Tax=Streptomyces djakartensis TaxID=68193 RepID=A0ABQ2Z6N5_9ACTN|nr:serine/threonine-protein kinase [Streptomyces djakartensis]GGY03044.1 serine/threonine protein kinase [Streptomyces djakartensis]